MPENLVFIAIVIAITLAIGAAAYGRQRGTRGGITQRSMRGRERTGGEGRSEASDRESFERQVDQDGTR